MTLELRQEDEFVETEKGSKGCFGVFIRIFICLLLLCAGAGVMVYLAKFKKPPEEAKMEEKAIRVETILAESEDIPVFISGYGEARPLNTVAISSEVAGKVVEIHPKLERGEVVSKGETLFRIDTADYESALRETTAVVNQAENTIARLKKQFEIDRDRLVTLERNRFLAEADFRRLKKLFEKSRVGTKSGVDAAEQRFNTVADQAVQMAQAVELYPIRIREAKNSLTAAKARKSTAEIRLSRCVVAAPFNGRVRQVMVEKDQYAAPGTPAVVLADDSVIEIHVPLDSREARNWLRFETGEKKFSHSAWFNKLVPAPCKVKWTESPEDHHWKGQLRRVVDFDQKTRTLTVAVRVSAQDAAQNRDGIMPLVEGMFCFVELPGRTLENVVRVPRWAVSFENTVFVSKENRLKTVPVTVAKTQGEQALISAGIKPGDIVVTTRLVDPLENSLLEFKDNA